MDYNTLAAVNAAFSATTANARINALRSDNIPTTTPTKTVQTFLDEIATKASNDDADITEALNLKRRSTQSYPASQYLSADDMLILQAGGYDALKIDQNRNFTLYKPLTAASSISIYVYSSLG